MLSYELKEGLTGGEANSPPIFANSTLSTNNSALASDGGEGGIRTHGPIAGTHAFQACRFDHSRTSPRRFSQGGILTRGLMTSKMTPVLVDMTVTVLSPFPRGSGPPRSQWVKIPKP